MHVIRPVGLSIASTTAVDANATWAPGTTYPLGAKVSRLGSTYISSINGNAGLPPEDEVQELEGARWIYVSATNTQALIDGSPSVHTSGASPLVVEIDVDGPFDSVALFQLDCSSCLIESVDGSGVVTSSETITNGAEPVRDWLAWLNTTFYRNTRRHIVYVSGFATHKVRLTIDGPAPSIGEVVIGRAKRIGSTQMDRSTRVDRRTFTKIVTNDFGITTVQKRAIARDATYQVHAKRKGFEHIERLLDDLDGIRVVTFAVEDDWPQLINIGFITDYSLPAELPDDFLFSVTTQGVS